ncbi:hypothetical protein CRUP_025503 [Coryphaenoides rupestris]|nr:hypothetical protein CRUP_025503 [Coryphaenoides rupestris]
MSRRRRSQTAYIFPTPTSPAPPPPTAAPPPHATGKPCPPDTYDQILQSMAQGRQVTYVELLKPVSGGLGFSVVGLRSENRGELGIFIQEIQRGSVAHWYGSIIRISTGKLREADQILAINGQPLDHTVTHQQAIGILQRASERVQLAVARGPIPQLASPLVSRTPSAASTLSANSSADGRLHSGDHILRIGDTDLQGMGSDQVAQVLRQCGNRVRLVVTRGPVDEGGPAHAVAPPRHLAAHRHGATEPSGIFVKSITKDSAVEQDGRIRVGDQIIAVDGVDIQGYTNQQAVEVLRHTGQTVHLRLVPRGFRPEETPPSPPAPLPPNHLPPGAVIPIPTTATVIRELELQEEEEEEETEMAEGAGLGTRLTAYEEQELTEKWQALLGPSNEVVVAQVEKFSESSGLGVSLEASGGHHYVRSVLPEGPVGRCGKLFSGDELLEVNGVSLIGESHKEVVRILKELPLCVYMACCRPAPVPQTRVDAGQSEVLSADSLVKNQIDLGGFRVPEEDTREVTTAVVAAAVVAVAAAAADEEDVREEEASLSSPLAMWESEVQHIELEKSEGGLGFSILDYQDPMDPAKTVIVIRSLVRGGVAERDGRLLPGDRLMFVNATDLENAALEDAVQALKGATLGAVQIGVAKPLPIDSGVGGGGDADLSEDQALELSYSGMEDDSIHASMIALHGWRLSGLTECDLHPDTLPVPLTPRRSEPLDEMPSFALDATEPFSSADTSLAFGPPGYEVYPGANTSVGGSGFADPADGVDLYGGSEPPEVGGRGDEVERAEVVESRRYDGDDAIGNTNSLFTKDGSELARLPAGGDSGEETATLGGNFERTITVVKGNASLGMTVSAVKDGLGMQVRSVIHGGSISRDGRLGAGDLILAINGEPTARLSNAQARAMLRRHSLIGPDLG